MTEEQSKQIQELHDFFMKPQGPGRPTRAKMIDDLLAAVRAGKIGGRAVLWLCGAVIAISGAYASAKGWFQ